MIGFKGFAGNKYARDALELWLINGQFEGLEVTGHWEPKEEWGSWGVEFSFKDASILKSIKKEWAKEGIVAERADEKYS